MGSRTPQWPRPCLKANQEGGEIEAVSLPEAVQDWSQQGPPSPQNLGNLKSLFLFLKHPRGWSDDYHRKHNPT